MVSDTPLSVLLMSVLLWGAVESSLKVQVSLDTSQEDVTVHPEAQHTDPGHQEHAIHLGNTQSIQTTKYFTIPFDQEQD